MGVAGLTVNELNMWHVGLNNIEQLTNNFEEKKCVKFHSTIDSGK